MQTVGNRGCIAQVVVVVEHGVRKGCGHVSDLFGLCHEVQGAMFDELQDIRHAIGTVKVDIALLLTDEGLVAFGLEELPGADEVLYHTDIGTCLDVEIASIEETADIQSWNELIGLVLRVDG